jgi:hypothetical protein
VGYQSIPVPWRISSLPGTNEKRARGKLK